MLDAFLTKLEPEQIGPSILSRLGGAAWTLGHSLTIVRQEVHNGALVERKYKGVEAVCLPAVDAPRSQKPDRPALRRPLP